MNQYLNEEISKIFRETINSSPIFYNGDLKSKYNLVCAVIDRIDTCVRYLNENGDYPATEEELIFTFVFAAMLRDSVYEILKSIGHKPAELIFDDKRYFGEPYRASAIFNADKDIPSDDRIFEYMRSLVFAHPVETSRARFLRDGETQYSPWVIVGGPLQQWSKSEDSVGIRIYSSVTVDIRNFEFPFSALQEYIKERYEMLIYANEWALEEIKKKQEEWLTQKIDRDGQPDIVLSRIKDILQYRFASVCEIDDLIQDMTCPISDENNVRSVSEYRKAIADAIPAICDGVESLTDIWDIPAYVALTEKPARMHPQAHYQLEKISAIANHESASGISYELSMAEMFANEFAQKWVSIKPKEISPMELQLLTRTACYLEAQAQKNEQQ